MLIDDPAHEDDHHDPAKEDDHHEDDFHSKTVTLKTAANMMTVNMRTDGRL